MDLANLATGAMKGATAGAALGPIGAAVGALLGAAPETLGALGIHLFDEPTASAALDLVRTVTGKPDPTSADVAGLSPDQRASLAVQMAQIAATRAAAERTADLGMMQAQLADVAGARGQTVALAQAGSRAVWGAPAVSVVVLFTFLAVMLAAIFRPFPTGSENVLTVLLGMLGSGFGAVVQYWVGSSAGSAAKDATIHAALARQ